jgi:hypothetical protein
LAVQVLTIATIRNYPIKRTAPEANKLQLVVVLVVLVVVMEQATGRGDLATVTRATRRAATQRKTVAALVQRGRRERRPEAVERGSRERYKDASTGSAGTTRKAKGSGGKGKQ